MSLRASVADAPAVLTRRLLAALALVACVAGLCLALLAHSAARHAREQALADARDHFAAQTLRLDEAWRTEAYALRQEIDLWLADAATLAPQAVDDRLRALLVSELAHSGFSRAVIVADGGEVLFRQGTRTGEAEGPGTPPAAPGWSFSREDRTVRRVLGGPLRYRDRAAQMLLYAPLDNALLDRLAYPGTRLDLRHDGQVVASTPPPAARAQDVERVRLDIAWDAAPGAPVLRVERELAPLLSGAEVLGTLAGGTLAFALLAWLVVGRWAHSQSLRLAELRRAALEFAAEPDAALRRIAEHDAHAARADDIAQLGGALHAMMQAIEAARAEREGASRALERHVAERTRDLSIANERLARSARFSRTVTDALPGHVSYWDAELRCRFANRGFLEWRRLDEAQVLGRHVTELSAPEWSTANVVGLQAALRGQAQQEERETLVEGVRHVLQMHLIPDRPPAGGIAGVFAIAFDISDLARARAELRRLNDALLRARDRPEAAVHAKSAFLANMSHEIRTPMNAILGLTYLALQAGLEGAPRDYVHKVHAAAEGLLRLLNGVLDFSKAEAGKLQLEREPFALAEVTGRAIDAVALDARAKGLALACRIDADVPPVLVGDAGRLGQVLLNLCANAVRFTAAGRIELRVELLQRQDAEADLLFSVADSGEGIPEDRLESIFEPFTQADVSTTRRHGGTGLGLTISRQLVEMMGGRLAVSSRVGEGSVFRFAVRLGSASAAPPATPPTQPLQALRGARVLVVEDNEVNQLVAEQMLRAAGVEVLLAGDGRKALEALDAHPGIDAVLMDCQMPVMDGYAATRALRADPRFAMLPVLAMTANVLPEDLLACRLAGMDDHIAKPFTADTLCAALGRWLKSARREAPAGAASAL